MFQNYRWSWKSNGKFLFAPTSGADRRGDQIIEFCEREVEFPACFYHYRKGGHVVALHGHLKNQIFFKIDIQNFFYSISRNRVAASLHQAGFPWARTFAKWSCVPNPHLTDPRYSLPIGFKQSPALASLVLMKSPLMAAITKAEAAGAFVSVYLDDLICSANDATLLGKLYDDFMQACVDANLTPNPAKIVPPTSEITVFNCDLRHGFACVTEARIAQYLQTPHSIASQISFDAYCDKVAEENTTA